MQVDSVAHRNDVEVVVVRSADRTRLEVSFRVLGENAAAREGDQFAVLDIKISDLVAKGTGPAASILGTLILNLLQQLVEGGIGFDDQDSNEHLEHLTRLMYERASKNDPDAQSYIGATLLSQSVANCDEAILDLAEEWFKKAADTGHEDSANFYQQTWPSVKESYLKEISMRKLHKGDEPDSN